MLKIRYYSSLIIISCFLLHSNNTEAQNIKKLFKKTKKSIKKTTKDVEAILDGKKNKETNNKKNESGEAEKKATFDFEKGLLIKAPNKKFEDFEIQKFKDLPRFGLLNDYSKTDAENNERLTRTRLDQDNYERYVRLLDFKFLDSYFDTMDKEYLLTPSDKNKVYYSNGGKNNREKVDRSAIDNMVRASDAQYIMQSTGYLLSSRKAKNGYFCNSDVGDCTLENDRTFRPRPNGVGKELIKSGIGTPWGGKSSSEFQQQRAYIAFAKDNLETMREWGRSLWKGEEQVVYVVERLGSLGGGSNSYEFKEGGYWIRLNFAKIGSKKGGFTSEYILKKRFEKDFEKREVLFKIGADKAEELTKKTRGELSGYLVYKCRLAYKSTGEKSKSSYGLRKSPVKYTYHLESPVVELYSDIALTNKFGEISLENPTYRN